MKPISLNVGELQQGIMSRVDALGGIGELDPNVSFFPNPGVIGFIIRNPDFGQLKPADLNRVSAGLADGLGNPVTILQDDGVLVGFFPQQILKF